MSVFATELTRSHQLGLATDSPFQPPRTSNLQNFVRQNTLQDTNWIRATEDVQLDTIEGGHSTRLERAEVFAKICDLNDSLAAKVKDLEGAKLVQDSTSKELTVAHQDIDELEEALHIEKCRSAKVERRLDKCKSEPEPTEQTDIK
ncbi:hypothetical protein K440DRAFT_644984 [Wilcoxina mikolae CBS 423.85]|nr:hypothetical protein K440DRAFT_644984 [Wilcoxina mikolae CBS 423.85]